MKDSNLLKALLVTILTCFSVNTFAQPPMSVDPEIQDLANRWTQAYNTHNPADLSALYSEDAYLMLHGALTLKGRQAIGEFWVDDFKEGNPLTTLTVTHSINGLDMILVHGNYQVIDRNEGLLLGQGRFAHMWMLDDNDEWELDRDIWHGPFNPY